MKTLKIILIVLGLAVVVIAIAGMYKFNYLANQSGYDVDGNRNDISDNSNSGEPTDSELQEMMTVKIADSELGGDFVFEEYQVKQTPGVLDATLEKLFEVQSNDEGRYNGFVYDEVILDNGIARIFLTGEFFAAGDLSGAYMMADIRNTVFQFDTVDAFEVYVNDRLFDWCVDDPSGGEGPCPEIPQLWTESR